MSSFKVYFFHWPLNHDLKDSMHKNVYFRLKFEIPSVNCVEKWSYLKLNTGQFSILDKKQQIKLGERYEAKNNLKNSRFVLWNLVEMKSLCIRNTFCYIHIRATSHMRHRLVIVGFQYLSLVEKVETNQVHFTPEGEYLRAQRNYHGWKTWIPTWKTINNVSCFARFCIKSTSMR